ncbi:MAG: SPASM domain-containing protein [Deltaproteobacteria bacterium]|nr:SPASM domain-containing protein [Deltaproteobacteria bacterium]
MKQDHEKRLKMEAAEERIQGKDGWNKFPLFWFPLFLSYRCTRRCSYCYAFNQVGDDSHPEMDENTFSRLLTWIPEVWNVNHVKVNAISFLGGEPLLRTDRIRKVMDAVCSHTDGMQGLVNTNGDLVDSVAWDDLEQIRWVTVNITDIGIGELSRRMKIIRDRSNVINQTIAATLDDFNLERIIDISRFGIENGYRLRFSKNLFKGADTDYKRRVLKKYHELCDLLEDYCVHGYDLHTTFLIDLLIPLWDLDESPYPCGKRIAAVFPDGTIGPCLRDHAFKTGTIFDADPLSKIRCSTFHFDVGESDIPTECRVCESKTTCQGGCPRDKLLLTGTRSGKSVVCEIHKEIIPRLRYLEQLKPVRPRSGR